MSTTLVTTLTPPATRVTTLISPASRATTLTQPATRVTTLIPPAARTTTLTPPAARVTMLTVGQGPAGAPGLTDNLLVRTVSTAIGGHRIVVSIGGQVAYADAANAAHRGHVLGMTLNAASAGGTVQIQSGGEVLEPTWTWTVDGVVYLGSNGVLTQTPPTPPSFLQVVGFAVAADRLFLNLLPPFILSE
jgi:hypothetical protein